MQLKSVSVDDVRVMKDAAEKLDNYNSENPQHETEVISQRFWGLIHNLEA